MSIVRAFLNCHPLSMLEEKALESPAQAHQSDPSLLANAISTCIKDKSIFKFLILKCIFSSFDLVMQQT